MTFLPMTTPLALAATVAKGTLLIALGWCGTALLKRAPAGTRHLIWLTVLVGILIVPILARFAPMNVPLLPGVAAVSVAAPVRESNSSPALEQSVATPRESSKATIAATSGTPARALSVVSFFVAAWVAIAGGFLVWLLTGMVSVSRIIRRGRTVTNPEWTRALGAAATSLKFAGQPRLVMSDQVEMAFAFDAFTPTIILPASAEEWSDDRRRAVLLHELAHIRRRDLIGHVIAGVACAVYWFNPFVWAAARRLRVESELASDDVVLASGVRPSDYAQHLLDLVTSVGRGAPTVALAMARPREFEGRLVAILDRAKTRHAPGRAQVGALVGLLGVMTVCIAAAVPVRRTVIVSAPATTVAVSPTVDSFGPRLPKPTENDKKANAAVPRVTAAPLSNVAVATLLRFGTSAVINPMVMILRSADVLHLTGAQADSIATLNRAYMIRLNAIWSPVSSYYLSHATDGNETPLNADIRRAPKASIDELLRIVPSVEGVLTPEQRRLLPPRIANYLDAGTLGAIVAGQTSDPGGIFPSDAGFLGGARGGGRRGR